MNMLKTPNTGAVAVVLGLLACGPAHAGQTDEAFFNYLKQVCSDPGIPFGSPLFETCDSAFPGGLAGAAFSPSAGVSNLGISGGTSSSSQTSAAQQRKELEKRIEGEEEGKKGGGAAADVRFGRFGAFFSVQYSNSDRDQTDLEQGYDSDLTGALAGLDYRFGDALIAGVSLGYVEDDLSYDQNSGGLDTKSWSATLYATYAPQDNAYLGAYFGYGDLDYDGTRNVLFNGSPATPGGIRGTTRSSTEGEQWRAGISGGYDWSMGRWTAGGFAKLDYVTTDVDAYTESGNTGLEMIYPSQTSRSLLSTLGVRASTTWGRVSPELRVGWAHEFKNDSRQIDTRLAVSPNAPFIVTTDAPDRDYLVSGVGAVVETGGSLLLFVDYERTDGHSYLDTWAVSAGVTGEF